jgi:hypothetical protein
MRRAWLALCGLGCGAAVVEPTVAPAPTPDPIAALELLAPFSETDPAPPSLGLNLFVGTSGLTWRGLDGAELRSLAAQGPAWVDVELAPDGGVLVLDAEGAVSRRDGRGVVRWRVSLGAHDDVDLLADGRVLTVAAVERALPTAEGPLRMIDEQLVLLSASGEELYRGSVWDMFSDRFPLEMTLGWRRQQQEHGRVSEPLQVRTVDLIAEAVPQLSPPNAVLLTLAALDVVALVDLEQPRMYWSWGGGRIERPLHAEVLADGHVLLVDEGSRRGHSRILEVDPRSGEVHWQHDAAFSATRAGVQRLPNGHTLVSWLDSGLIEEITVDGRLSWSAQETGVGRVRRVEAGAPTGR